MTKRVYAPKPEEIVVENDVAITVGDILDIIDFLSN